MAEETPENRLRRLHMRSWRRGIKEMDIILGQYSDAKLTQMDKASLDTYEAILEENDQDLYRWVTGQAATPEHLLPLLDEIAAHAGAR